MASYWHYTFKKVNQKEISYSVGTQYSYLDEFDFADYYSTHPDCYLLSVNRISEEQYKKLNDIIKRSK